MCLFHRDVVKEKITIPAPITVASRAGLKSMKGVNEEFFKETLVLIFKCEKCGRERSVYH